ncbi:hypothetical protein K7X08_028218 [Anisodus acutangulus]|uniref:Uncharacterized protein n=1 Tax=Anisodus acutangulus TaxID=402998 RepID=A0A9Q1MU81_9SOLA|nr:hypothetical protein K7X08_028218 [Anisodus acutangulus]
MEKGKAREEGNKPVVQQSLSDGVFKNEKLIYENWNVVHNRKNKGPNNEPKQLEKGKQGEQGNINTAGKRKKAAQSTSTANKFESLKDLTEEQQRDLVVPDKDNNVTQVQQDKKSRKIKETINTGIENNHKEQEINDEHQSNEPARIQQHGMNKEVEQVDSQTKNNEQQQVADNLVEDIFQQPEQELTQPAASSNMKQSQDQEIKAISIEYTIESESNKGETNRQLGANIQTISTYKSDEQQQGRMAREVDIGDDNDLETPLQL